MTWLGERGLLKAFDGAYQEYDNNTGEVGEGTDGESFDAGAGRVVKVVAVGDSAGGGAGVKLVIMVGERESENEGLLRPPRVIVDVDKGANALGLRCCCCCCCSICMTDL